MREIFLSVGELGWALYLSAHLRWRKKQGKLVDAVMCLPGQDCLYEGLADKIFHAHWKHKEGIEQECFGFYGLPDYKLRAFFNAKVPAGYEVAKSQPLQALSREEIFPGQMIFKPYPSKTNGEKVYILVFPRCRPAYPFSIKDLPKEFYIKLINTLCDEFQDKLITAVGTKDGAYNITEIKRDNYMNFVGKTPTIQELIDMLQISFGAVGSQSAPPKIALLQGVPTYMIGHTKKRHQNEENWSNTRCGFWEIGFGDYNDFNDEKCIDAIVEFFKK